MRLPNGYGSIVKLGGKRRRPFGVRVTVEWTDEGKQKYKYLGYFEKKSDAIQALAESDYSHGQARGVLTTKFSL